MVKKRIILGVVIACISGAALAQTRRPITHEDVWLMKRVGAPIPSPDGKLVVFSVVEPAYDDKDQVSDLWVVPTGENAKLRRLTFTKGVESGATWSPDSRKIAFSAKREGDEVNQIYIIDVVTGGEAIRVTTLSTGARSPQFSPDGKAILFQSSVYPGAMNDEDNKRIAAERKDRKYRARVYEEFPIRNWDRWLEDLQTHLIVQSIEPGTKPKDLLAGTRLAGERGFAGAITPGGDDLQPVWAPDGQSIVFVSMTNRNTAAHSEPSTDLYQVSLNGGEPKQLTTGKDSHSRPMFSPDGKSLYCIVNPATDKVYNLDRIARFDWPNIGARKIVTESFDRSPSSFVVGPDSKAIWLTAEDSGFEHIYVASPDGNVSQFSPLREPSGVYTNLAMPSKAADGALFANWESATNPAEIVRIPLVRGRGGFPLTGFNDERLKKIDSQPLRHFTFTSKRGKQIHSMIALPPNFDENKKYPLFVVIHGGPHSMWRDQFFIRWNYHLLAQPGYVVLLTNYTGSTGFGEKFAQEIQLDPLKGPGEEINEAADEAIKRFKFIDPSRQAAGGASYGGHLANWLQATTTRYKCLISHAGLVNLESQWATSDTIYSRELNNGGPVWEQGPVWREQNPIRYAAKFKTPMLITVGENDFRVPLNNSIENWSVLQRQRVPSKLIVFPEENHWILKGENSRFWYGEVHSWLKQWLNGDGQSN
ncbi:MAG TPA: S9 family peptidase [Blastocatellia bacterium]|nr:S9 family peptidase [Blastocatellia bacterium]